jgi:hypothetical protein
MQTSSELRAEARLCKQAVIREANPHVRRRLIDKGLAFADLAEKIDREALRSKPRTR